MEGVKAIIVSGGMVPVFNHKDPEVGCRVVQSCFDAGLKVFEWTNRGAEAEGLFKTIKEYIDKNCPGMLLGAGSVFDGDTCRRFHRMGASFIVSPVLEPEMAKTCKELKIMWIPGCGKATEIHQAYKWGASIVKVFPGDSAGGPGFIKAVLGPMPWAQIMPTGGVSPDIENLKAWFDSGVCCVGMGSKLFTNDLIADKHQLTEAVLNVIDIIRRIRNTINKPRF
jgi:2-dehydro-3-deoxyphosphogluconate aldolase/(4S)-4-hydroxy-2-oxoglutarate aldolase